MNDIDTTNGQQAAETIEGETRNEAVPTPFFVRFMEKPLKVRTGLRAGMLDSEDPTAM